MASVNKVCLLGRLGADPELRYLSSGTPVGSLRVATNRSYKNNAGETVEQTEWHQVEVFGKNAENCKEYLKKGRSVYLEGRLQTNSWDDAKTGQKRYSTKIVTGNVQFLSDGKKPANTGTDEGKPEAGYEENIPF